MIQRKFIQREGYKSERRMPRLLEAKKDVVSCEKLRGTANRFWSGDFRMGQPGWLKASHWHSQSKRGELKHLSTRVRSINMVAHLQCAGLPHSEIAGSKPVCSSPTLIAAYHVLHRLQKPRHPPFALVTFSLYDFLFESLDYVYTLDLTFTRCLEIAVHNITIDSLSF